jgi:hypothetical protein
MAQWRIKNGEEIIGPFSGTELLARVRRGEVAPETLVQKGDSRWVAAEEINGLFEAIGQKALEYHCPECREVVHKPPTHCEVCGAFVERAEMVRFTIRSAEQKPVPLDGKSFWQKLGDTWKRWTE